MSMRFSPASLIALCGICGLTAPMAALAQLAPAAPAIPAKPAAPTPAFTPATPATAPSVNTPAPVATKPAFTPAPPPALKPTGVGHNLANNATLTGIPQPANSPFDFETTFHDFGKIADTAPVTFEFKFKNKTDRPIKITNVQATCGCTSVASDPIVEAGKSSVIKTTFDPKGRNGREIKTVTVYTDDPNCPQIQLQTAADVQKRIMLEPFQVWFGEVKFGASAEQVLSVTGRAENFDVTDIKVPDARFKFERVGNDKAEVNGEMLNRVKFKFSIEPGIGISRAQTSATLTTNDPLSPTVNVALIVDVVGNLRVMPTQLGVRMTRPAEPFAVEMFIDSRDGKPFEITSMEYDLGPNNTNDLKAMLDVEPRTPDSKSSFKVKFTGVTPGQAGDIRGAVKIRTTDKDQELISIPVMGFQMSPSQPGTINPPVRVNAAPAKASMPLPVPTPGVKSPAIDPATLPANDRPVPIKQPMGLPPGTQPATPESPKK